MASLSTLTKKGTALFLAYDQGLEHGPSEFNDANVDPRFIIHIAKEGKYTAMIFQKGIAEKYQKEIRLSKIPLIIKLNGKTNLVKGEPISRQLCSVNEALKLGAKAVGYTIYLGSQHESRMFNEFEQIEEEAHAKKIPVIAWIYPRGKAVEHKPLGELMTYAARTGLELGADIVKLQYNGSLKDLKWAVKSAGRTALVLSGGPKTDETSFLSVVKDAKAAGCLGVAVGRNIWKSSDPISLSKKVWNNLQ